MSAAADAAGTSPQKLAPKQRFSKVQNVSASGSSEREGGREGEVELSKGRGNTIGFKKA